MVGGKVHTGNVAFSHFAIKITNDNKTCSTDGSENYINRNGTTLAMCPNFWTAFGNPQGKTCNDFSEDILSWQMESSGGVILHALMSLIGQTTFSGNTSLSFEAQSSLSYSGPASAINIRTKYPSSAMYSVTNYDWYALVGVTCEKKKSPSNKAYAD